MLSVEKLNTRMVNTLIRFNQCETNDHYFQRVDMELELGLPISNHKTKNSSFQLSSHID